MRASATAGTFSLEVSDTGDGIPADELGAVMQRFYRRDRARTPGQGGLGLGLAIVKHMVQQMGERSPSTPARGSEPGRRSPSRGEGRGGSARSRSREERLGSGSSHGARAAFRDRDRGG